MPRTRLESHPVEHLTHELFLWGCRLIRLMVDLQVVRHPDDLWALWALWAPDMKQIEPVFLAALETLKY